MSACGRTDPTSDWGFSLLELMIVSVLLGLFLLAVQESAILGLRQANAADEREDARQQLARAVDQMTREMSAAYGVDNAEDQRFQFDARDINGDGSNDNNINYVVTSGDLYRGSMLLVRDLSALDFNYLDGAGASMSTPVAGADEDDIRVVQITMSATRDQDTVSLTSAAYLRNM